MTTIKSEGNINVCIKFHSNNQKYQPGGGAGGKVRGSPSIEPQH